MRFQSLAIGASVIAALSGAQARNRASSQLAAVDASGRVLPIAPASTTVERIDSTDAASPCAGDKPMPPQEARALVLRIATQENFYPDFVLSVAKSESRFNSVALSEKGAFGLMQLTPGTAKRFKVDLCDPAGNVLGGVRFLRMLHEKYRNPFFILAAYNAGEDAVEKSRSVPPNPETVRYVAEVINDFYTWSAPGRAASRQSRTAAGASPDVNETGAVGASAFKSTSKSSARWNNGVMHVDRGEDR